MPKDTAAETETITITIEKDLDEIHASMLDTVAGATPSREAAIDGLTEQLAADIEASGRVEELIHNSYQTVVKQRNAIQQQTQQQAEEGQAQTFMDVPDEAAAEDD